MALYLHYLILIKEIAKQYTMHLFGIIGFLSTFILGSIALFNYSNDLLIYLPYGILVFVMNLFYLKVIKLSTQDHEKRLEKEKQYSQELLKSQKLFLRHAIHETNTPLAVIMANIELFELESGKHPTLSNIEAATKNIYGIYDDLSYLTKKDKILYPKTELSLGDFIKSRLEFFDIVAKQSNLTFDFHSDCDKTNICINETKLQRIVDNNITNAIKYSKEFEVIQIVLQEDTDHCIFEISSNSTIIQDPKKIFKAYYRENRKKDGLGLGLNLVKKICDEEHITIELLSKEDVTSFTYYFKKAPDENFTA